MIENGSNDPRNPIWKFLMSLWDIEVLVVQLVLGLVLAFGVVYVIHGFYDNYKENLRRLEKEKEDEKRREIAIQEEIERQKLKVKEDEGRALTSTQANPRVMPVIEKSPEELKKRAIEQILRGW